MTSFYLNSSRTSPKKIPGTQLRLLSQPSWGRLKTNPDENVIQRQGEIQMTIKKQNTTLITRQSKQEQSH